MTIKLFEPYKIKDVTLKNRIVMSPMCMYSCYNEDGLVTDWHRTHYTSRAVGQVGLIILEATAITAQGRISLHDLGIWDDTHVQGLRELVNMMKEHEAAVGIQLAHAGRKADIPEEIIAPSAIGFSDHYQVPKEMTVKEIEETITAFKNAAVRSKEAGFDCIEIHAAHGYLINQFLSPLTNLRTDEYGGSLENRYRFLKEVIEEVKEAWDRPLFVRISASDYDPNGLHIEEYIQISSWLKGQGVDLVDVSSGGVVSGARINIYPGYQVPFAEKIKAQAEMPSGAVGLITSALHAEEILQSGRADLIFMGRELLRNPYWPYVAAKELGANLEAPIQYKRGWL